MALLTHRNKPRRDCRERDEDLLLYVHREQSPLARQRTALHLRRCPTCRERVAELTRISLTLADAIRGDELPSWRPPRAIAGPWQTFLLPRLPLLIAFVVVLLISATVYRRNAEATWPGANLIKSIGDACDADIQRAMDYAKGKK